MTTVYLAGPMVFYPEPEAVFDEMKAILAPLGLEGVAPIDNQAALEGVGTGTALARRIYKADVEIMKSVDAAIFNIDPFRRGVEMDAGTAFEVGYCRALGLKMTGWTIDGRTYPEKTAALFRDIYNLQLSDAPANESGATSGGQRDPDGMLVHSEGLRQNLMIEMAIRESGGAVYSAIKWRTAFTKAARRLSEIVVKQRP